MLSPTTTISGAYGRVDALNAMSLPQQLLQSVCVSLNYTCTRIKRFKALAMLHYMMPYYLEIAGYGCTPVSVLLPRCLKIGVLLPLYTIKAQFCERSKCKKQEMRGAVARISCFEKRYVFVVPPSDDCEASRLKAALRIVAHYIEIELTCRNGKPKCARYIA